MSDPTLPAEADGATLPPAPRIPDGEAGTGLAPPQRPDELGRLGPYRVLKVLGAGGMGTVYQAEDLHLLRLVALKVMNPSLAASETGRQRFLLEARAAAAIEHDHIVAIHQVGEDRGIPYFAMPFLKGESLEDRLHRQGRLPLAEVLRIGRETAEGLAAAHERGLIHRDVKPANIWLEEGRGRIKILDFGLVRAAGQEQGLTRPGSIMGTPEYMAPEQGRGAVADERADLFSLGCVLYRLCTGELPFQGADWVATLMAVATEEPPPVEQRNPEVPPALSALIRKLLAKDPAQRPASARTVVEVLRALEEGQPERARQRVGAMPSTGKKRQRLLLAGAVLALAAGAVLLGYRFWKPSGGQIEKDEPSGGKAPVPKPPAVLVTDFDFLLDADWPECDAWVKRLDAVHARPAYFSVHNLAGQPRFSAVAVWEDPFRDWYLWQSPDRQSYVNDTWKPRRDEGFREVQSGAFHEGGATRYLSCWVKDALATWWSDNGLTEQRYQEVLARQKALGQRLLAACVLREQNDLHFQAVTAPDSGIAWEEHHGLTAQQLQTLLEGCKARHWRPDYLYAYQDREGPRFLVVLVENPEDTPWAARLNLSREECRQEVQALKGQSLRPLSLAGYAERGETRYAALWLHYQPRRPVALGAAKTESRLHWKALWEADEPALDAWMKEVRATGFRPIAVSGHGLAGKPRLAALAVKDHQGGPWEDFRDRFHAYPDRFREMRKRDFWPANIAVYPQEDGLAVASIWTPNPFKEGAFSSEYDMTPDRFRARLNDAGRSSNGPNPFYPSHVSVYPVGRSFQLAGLFSPVPKGGLPNWCRWDTSAEEYQAFLDEYRPRGYRPLSVSVCPVNGQPRFTAILIDDGRKLSWQARKDLSAAALAQELRRWQALSYRPYLIAGYPDRGESRYLAVWVRDAVSLGPRTGTEVPELAALDDAMQQFMSERDIPAGALAVMRDGKLLLARGYGFADREQKLPVAPDAPFRLASVTKAITNAAVRKLIREGKLRPETKVAALLELAAPPGRTMDPRWRQVTVQHLLDHKGGWDRQKTFDPMFRALEIAETLGKPGPATAEDVIRYMAGQPLQFDPGSKSAYSNFGYCLLGRVIEKVTGRSYIDYVRGEVLAPLGIKGVALGSSLPAGRAAGEPYYAETRRGRNVLRPNAPETVPLPDGGFYLEAMDAHGGLIGSAVDVVRFLQAYSLDGQPRTKPPLAGCYFGLLKGTWAMALQRADGVQMAALFNQSSDPSGLAYSRIRDMLDKAADSVRAWPAREVVLPSR